MAENKSFGDGLKISRKPGTSRTSQPPQKVYRITIGSHLDNRADWIGHAYISLEYPIGFVKTRGFWPANGFDLSDKRDKWGVIFGMPGKLRNDHDYLVKTEGLNARKTFSIDENQAKRAQRVIKEYTDNPPSYTLWGNQCAIFAVRVLRATGNNVSAGFIARPSKIYESISGDKL